MTIDSNNTVRATNSINENFYEPPNIELSASRTRQAKFDERLFLCSKNIYSGNYQKAISEKKSFDFVRTIRSIVGIRRFGIWHKIQPEPDEKLPKCLAFKANLYYNNELDVVGMRFMQAVAKLRKVAEVLITDSIYLKLPHIANSKRTIVAK